MSFELLGIGKALAGDLGSNVCAFAIGDNVDNFVKEAFGYGASKVFAVEGDVFKGFRTEAYSKAASFLLDKYKPEIALFRATTQGMDVATAGAAQLLGSLKEVQIDEVIMGNVLQAGLGQNSARQACIRGGVPKETGAYTINKVCSLGLRSIINGIRSIEAGDNEVVGYHMDVTV